MKVRFEDSEPTMLENKAECSLIDTLAEMDKAEANAIVKAAKLQRKVNDIKKLLNKEEQ